MKKSGIILDISISAGTVRTAGPMGKTGRRWETAEAQNGENMESTLRRTWAETDLDAIEFNYKKIRSTSGRTLSF